MAGSVIGPASPQAGATVASAQPVPPHKDPAEAPSSAATPANFDELVHRHLDHVWRLLRRLGLSASDADDAALQVFMIASRKLGALAAGTERAFLYGTARRVAESARRDSRRHDAPGELAAEVAALEALPDDRLELARAAALLDDLLSQLPEELRRVLVLAELEQATVPEIAELESIPESMAASRVQRALASFDRVLARAAPGSPFAGEAR